MSVRTRGREAFVSLPGSVGSNNVLPGELLAILGAAAVVTAVVGGGVLAAREYYSPENRAHRRYLKELQAELQLEKRAPEPASAAPYGIPYDYTVKEEAPRRHAAAPHGIPYDYTATYTVKEEAPQRHAAESAAREEVIVTPPPPQEGGGPRRREFREVNPHQMFVSGIRGFLAAPPGANGAPVPPPGEPGAPPAAPPKVPRRKKAAAPEAERKPTPPGEPGAPPAEPGAPPAAPPKVPRRKTPSTPKAERKPTPVEVAAAQARERHLEAARARAGMEKQRIEEAIRKHEESGYRGFSPEEQEMEEYLARKRIKEIISQIPTRPYRPKREGGEPAQPQERVPHIPVAGRYVPAPAGLRRRLRQAGAEVRELKRAGASKKDLEAARRRYSELRRQANRERTPGERLAVAERRLADLRRRGASVEQLQAAQRRVAEVTPPELASAQEFRQQLVARNAPAEDIQAAEAHIQEIRQRLGVMEAAEEPEGYEPRRVAMGTSRRRVPAGRGGTVSPETARRILRKASTRVLQGTRARPRQQAEAGRQHLGGSVPGQGDARLYEGVRLVQETPKMLQRVSEALIAAEQAEAEAEQHPSEASRARAAAARTEAENARKLLRQLGEALDSVTEEAEAAIAEAAQMRAEKNPGKEFREKLRQAMEREKEARRLLQRLDELKTAYLTSLPRPQVAPVRPGAAVVLDYVLPSPMQVEEVSDRPDPGLYMRRIEEALGRERGVRFDVVDAPLLGLEVRVNRNGEGRVEDWVRAAYNPCTNRIAQTPAVTYPTPLALNNMVHESVHALLHGPGCSMMGKDLCRRPLTAQERDYSEAEAEIATLAVLAELSQPLEVGLGGTGLVTFAHPGSYQVDWQKVRADMGPAAEQRIRWAVDWLVTAAQGGRPAGTCPPPPATLRVPQDFEVGSAADLYTAGRGGANVGAGARPGA
jgi:truncated hemoglobin YjbI